eukprot:450072_1
MFSIFLSFEPDMLWTVFLALIEYGANISDELYQSFILQTESDKTANWSQVLGPEMDDVSLGYLIRDYTTPNDYRYRDERYGIPWNTLIVLNNNDIGMVNNCCLDNNQCNINSNNITNTISI